MLDVKVPGLTSARSTPPPKVSFNSDALYSTDAYLELPYLIVLNMTFELVSLVNLTVATPLYSFCELGLFGSYVGPRTNSAPFDASAVVKTPSPNSDCATNCFSINFSVENLDSIAVKFVGSKSLKSVFIFSSVVLLDLKSEPSA